MYPGSSEVIQVPWDLVESADSDGSRAQLHGLLSRALRERNWLVRTYQLCKLIKRCKCEILCELSFIAGAIGAISIPSLLHALVSLLPSRRLARLQCSHQS